MKSLCVVGVALGGNKIKCYVGLEKAEIRIPAVSCYQIESSGRKKLKHGKQTKKLAGLEKSTTELKQKTGEKGL